MADTPKTYTIDRDLEAALIASAVSGEPVKVKHSTTLRVRVDEPVDLWADYDEEAALDALEQTAGILRGVDAEALINRLREVREQDSSGRPAER